MHTSEAGREVEIHLYRDMPRYRSCKAAKTRPLRSLLRQKDRKARVKRMLEAHLGKRSSVGVEDEMT